MPDENQTAAPPLTSLRVVVDETLPRDELRVHPAMFNLLQEAFMEAEGYRQLEFLRKGLSQ